MKKLAIGVAALVGVLALAIALGPRPVVDEAVTPPRLTADLDAYLAAAEARVENVIPGAEKTIIWADSTHRRTPVSVVYLHGFSATRQETAPLSDTLAARLGANLFYTRLTGHGRTGDVMGEATVNDWLQDGTEAMAIGEAIGERVILVGTSTGGTLATWLAARPGAAEKILAVVLLSPNYGPKDDSAEMLLWPWGADLARASMGTHHEWTPMNEEQGMYWTTRYPVTSLATMMGLVDLVGDIDLSTVTAPVVVVYSPDDQVVDAAKTEAYFPRFGASNKRLIPLAGQAESSNHVLAGAIVAPEGTLPIADSILAFIHPLLGE